MVRTALAVFAIALVVRLFHVWQLRASPFFSVLMGDSRGYDDWARQIAAGDWFGHDVFYQAPLYPYLLGVIYAVAGRHLLLVRVVQAIIGSASCALLALAAARLFSRRTGLVAGLMLALYAPAIFFDGLIQKSVLDVFFVCLSLFLIGRITGQTSHLNAEPAKDAKQDLALRSSRPLRSLSWNWFCLGLAMGGLALTRENALVFILVILAWIIVRGLGAGGLGLGERRSSVPSSQRRAPTLRRAGLFLAGLALVLIPVAARNSIVGGGFYITTSQFGPNLYIGNNPAADGTYQSLRYGRGAPEFERQDATDLAEHALGKKLTPSEVSSYWTDKALEFITSHPAAWLRLTSRKVALLWNATEMLDTESQDAHAEWSLPLRLGGVIGHFGILVPLALFGVIVTWPMRSRLWIFYAMTIAYAASVVIFYVFARYRYPLVPLLMLFAAAGLVAVPEMVRRRAVTGGLTALAAVAAVAVFTNWPILSATLMRAVTETNLGTALQGDGRLEEATSHYQRAIAIRADYAPAYNNMATVLRAKGRLGDAVATYQRAIALRPEYPEAEYNLANALLEEGNADEAIAHFERALQSISGSVDVHNNLGIALAAKGKQEEATAEFRAALQVDPDSAKSHRNLGDVLASAGQRDEAIDHLRRAAQLDPGDASAHYDLGSLFLEMHRLDEAVAEFRAALKLTPDSVETHNNLGIALGSQGKVDEAIAEFRQALKIEPKHEDARRNLEMALEARRR